MDVFLLCAPLAGVLLARKNLAEGVSVLHQSALHCPVVKGAQRAHIAGNGVHAEASFYEPSLKKPHFIVYNVGKRPFSMLPKMTERVGRRQVVGRCLVAMSFLGLVDFVFDKAPCVRILAGVVAGVFSFLAQQSESKF